MAKRANPMAVKAALTYEIAEAADLLGKTPATIRNWIKDGLPVMSSKKPYLISGAAIREFLRAKSKEAKRPLATNELFCTACGAGCVPLDMAVSIKRYRAKTSLLKGVCCRCGACATRMVGNTQVAQFAKIFDFKEGQ